MSKAPKQSGVQTTTQKVELPAWLDERYQGAASNAANIYNQGKPEQFYPFSTVNPLANATMSGLNTQMGIANAGGVSDNAFNQWNDTLQGNYLDNLTSGEGFANAQQAAANRIIPQVTSAFNSGGRMGGGAGESELTRQLGDSFANLYGDMYNAERNREMAAVGMAPAMETLAYEPARRQMQVGTVHDAKAAEKMAEKMDRFRFNQQDFGGNRLDDYIARLQGISPNFRGGTTTQPIMRQGSSLGQLGGLALGAAGLMTGNPWLGLAGGAGSGLLGGGMDLNSMYQPTGAMGPGSWLGGQR